VLLLWCCLLQGFVYGCSEQKHEAECLRLPAAPLCSVSLKLVYDIGYWDTFPDAIGEDMHMFIKAFMRTNGATHLYPIHAPINMLHVQGPNWVMSLWARFLQVCLGTAGIDTAIPCAWIADVQ
jgi:hypothetical protein